MPVHVQFDVLVLWNLQTRICSRWILSQDERAPHANFQKVNGEAVDVMLHGELVLNGVAVALGMSVDVTPPIIVFATSTACVPVAEAFKPDQIRRKCVVLSVPQDEDRLRPDVLVHEASPVYGSHAPC